jgi:hypothetical protein
MHRIASRVASTLILIAAHASAQPREPIAQQLTFTPDHTSGIYDIGETVG